MDVISDALVALQRFPLLVSRRAFWGTVVVAELTSCSAWVACMPPLACFACLAPSNSSAFTRSSFHRSFEREPPAEIAKRTASIPTV